MNPTWITACLTLFVTMTAGLGAFARATITGANFFTYRYRLVMQARKDRLDLAEQFAHLGESGAAQDQIDVANKLVAKAIILTEAAPARRGRIWIALISYATFVVALALLVEVPFVPHSLGAWFTISGMVFMLIAIINLFTLMLLIGKDDRRADRAASAHAARFTNPSTYCPLPTAEITALSLR